MRLDRLLASLLTAACLLFALVALTGCSRVAAEPAYEVVTPAACTCGCGKLDCSCAGDCELVAVPDVRPEPTPAIEASLTKPPAAKEKAKIALTGADECADGTCPSRQPARARDSPRGQEAQPVRRVLGAPRRVLGRVFGGRCGAGGCR